MTESESFSPVFPSRMQVTWTILCRSLQKNKYIPCKKKQFKDKETAILRTSNLSVLMEIIEERETY
jgi:hypothetical protein